ncbi:zinc ABC transporter ATP-binding protein AztA [Amycolatopsis regifaucium]|uniref:ABC transporter n=1 Tax=Amycolatopsis regifaucium TaxID=546365 RepID=A0A154M3V8_9PSEU|nr:zinc ABC transporter ATP-binding protein AztA [Amycolatopsis regifaucium]KZB79304.1 ABC transporter [Amycolatopsis regifaucium]OKA07486.1 ABC transporter [Amycolatopsis regifaucium]SFH10405.1 zinc/manganese transport system ATP-binding protein [Amycolatopsis regifaucium]
MNSDTTALTLDGVHAHYGHREVLCGVTAEVPHGRLTAVVGANGAGKSSLLNVVAGVLPPTAGSCTRRDPRRVAYVTQQSEVSSSLPVTVRATVTMGRWAHRGPWRRLSAMDREVVEECMARLDITSIAHRMLGTLSGGQRQRALVAQGLAQQAGLLLLDEPSAGLDLHARAMIDEALRTALAEGTTILRVTHDLAVARRADHCLLLRDGHLVAAGPPSSVLTSGQVAEAWGIPLTD